MTTDGLLIDTGPAGDAASADVLVAEDSTNVGCTFAALLAVLNEDDVIEAPNANVDLVVVVSVVVSGVSKSAASIDADGSHVDRLDRDLSTGCTGAENSCDTPLDSESGTCFKTEVRARVTDGGALCVYTTDGCKLYLTSNETPIIDGTGITAAFEDGTETRSLHGNRIAGKFW